jgi:hypothetical protein
VLPPEDGSGHLHDFMSYGDNAFGNPRSWISPQNWRVLFETLGGVSASRVGRAARSATAAAPAGPVAGHGIVVAGYLPPGGGGHILSVLRSDAQLSPPPAPGPASGAVIVRSTSGRTLESYPIPAHNFDLSPADPIPFLIVLPDRGTPAAIVIKRGKRVVAQLRRSPHPPRGRFTGLRRASRIKAGRPLVLRWRTKDADGDKVRSSVFLDAKGQSRVLALSASGQSARVAAKIIPRGRFRLRLLMSDGLNATTVRSPKLKAR